MQTPPSRPDSFKDLFVSIILGLLVGLISTLFIKSLYLIENQQRELNAQPWPLHVFLIPPVLIFLFLLKRNTLYFPTKVSELRGWNSESCLAWSPFMSAWHFLGSTAGHMAGASVGREGVVVLMAAGLVRAFRLSWVFWGPVAMGCGFSAILGNPWIGLVFMGELYATQFKQKFYLLIASMFSYLLMRTLQVPHFLAAIEIQNEISFTQMLLFVVVMALCAGFAMRVYKDLFLRLSAFFHRQSLTVKFLFALVLMGLLLIPELRRFQSLGLLQLENLNELPLGFKIPVLKLLLTLFSVTLGFWGGEFVPLVYVGLHFGATLSTYMGIPQISGTYMGSFLFFAGSTRLKWTAFFLVLSLMGFSWLPWLLFLFQLTVGFSGSKSLYQPHE